MYSFIQQIFQVLLKLRGDEETLDSLPPHFHPILFISQGTETQFLPYSKTGLSEVISDFLPIQLLLIWLFFSVGLGSIDHLLPLGTVCLRIILYFSEGLFPIPLTEFSSIPSFINKGSMRFLYLVPFYSLLALFLYLKELTYSYQFHLASFITPRWVAAKSLSSFLTHVSKLFNFNISKIELILFFTNYLFMYQANIY